jgi:hypothetical protein
MSDGVVCVGLITHREESYWVYFVSLSVAPIMRRPCHTRSLCAMAKRIRITRNKPTFSILIRVKLYKFSLPLCHRKLKSRPCWFETDIYFLPIICWYLSKYIGCTHDSFFFLVICDDSIFLDSYNHNGVAVSGSGSFHKFLIFIFFVVSSSMVIASDDRLSQINRIFPLLLILLNKIRFFHQYPEHSGCHEAYRRMHPLYPIKLPCSVSW